MSLSELKNEIQQVPPQNLAALKDFIAELEEEHEWDLKSSTAESQQYLEAMTLKIKTEIAAGQSKPMDYEKLWTQIPSSRFGQCTVSYPKKFASKLEPVINYLDKIQIIQVCILSALDNVFRCIRLELELDSFC